MTTLLSLFNSSVGCLVDSFDVDTLHKVKMISKDTLTSVDKQMMKMIYEANDGNYPMDYLEELASNDRKSFLDMWNEINSITKNCGHIVRIGFDKEIRCIDCEQLLSNENCSRCIKKCDSCDKYYCDDCAKFQTYECPDCQEQYCFNVCFVKNGGCPKCLKAMNLQYRIR